MIGARLPRRSDTGDLVLAGGLVLSAVLVAVLGGWPGRALAVVQVMAAIGVLARPDRPGVLAVVALVLGVAPLAAVRHWTARLPLACKCLQTLVPAPGVASLTGLLVVIDLALGGLAVWLARSGHGTEATDGTNGL